MNDILISEAQDYLTVRRDEDYKRIVDIRHLIQKHGEKEVADFLKAYLKEKEKALRNMILIDKTSVRIDQFAGAIFRIMMAIKILEGKEVNIIDERPEQGTEESGLVQKRNSGRNKRRRIWENQDHDGEDRIPRYASQRHA